VADVPFLTSADNAKRQSASHIHNYFFVKGLDTLRESGVMAFITSQGVADAPANRTIREYLMNHADLVSAVRLPNNLFADTEVGTDVIVLQKNSHKKEMSEREKLFVENTKTKTGITINEYMYSRRNMIFTDSKVGKNMYSAAPAIVLTHSGGVGGVSAELSAKLNEDIKNHFNRELYDIHLLPKRQEHAQSSEPSAGAGQFADDFSKVFNGAKITAFEKDILTGKVLQYLRPNDNVHIAGFETIGGQQNGTFDIITSNLYDTKN
jgi:hypothetical protein